MIQGCKTPKKKFKKCKAGWAACRTKKFEPIEDHRFHNKLHKLIDVIIIAICGVVAGADRYEQIENFGKNREQWPSRFLELPYGIPSHDTFDRIFERMNPHEFQNSFKKWIASVAKQTKGQVVAIDGKTLPGILFTDSSSIPRYNPFG